MNRTTPRPYARLRSAVVIAACLLIYPQASPASQTLAETIEKALIKRPETALSRLDSEAANARLKAARARQLPRLDFTLSNDINTLVDPFTGVVATTVINGQPVSVEVTRSSPRSVLVAIMRLSYPLYTGGRNTANYNAARFDADGIDVQASIAASEVARSVALAWFAVHRANLDAQNRAHLRALSERRAALTELRVQRGLSARIELETAHSEVQQQNVELAHAHSLRSLRWSELSQVTGQAAVMPEPDWSNYTDISRLGEAISQLHSHAPEGARQRQHSAQVQAERQRLAAEYAGYKPKVSLFAQYAAVGRSKDTSLPIDDARRSDVKYGATLEWNFFEGFGNRARTSEQAAILAKRQLQLEEARRNLHFAVTNAEQQLRAEQLRLDALITKAPLLQRRLEIAQVRLKAGRTDDRTLLLLKRERATLTGQIRLAQLDMLAAHTRAIFARAVPEPVAGR